MLLRRDPGKTPFHSDSSEPAAENQGIDGSRKIHAKQKDKMGKAVGQRATHDDNPGSLQLEREDAQSEDRWPTEEKAEADGKNPGEHNWGGFFPKRAQVSSLCNSRLHKGRCREIENYFFDESFQLVLFDS